MHPRLTVVTLGVDDLERAVAFYRDGLQLPTDGIVGQEYEHGAVAFFVLAGGVRLALYARTNIARDAGLPPSPVRSPTAMTLGHNVREREDVDRVMEEAERAGARILRRPAPTAWGGYTGIFQDPDNHLWEVVWNPELLPP